MKTNVKRILGLLLVVCMIAGMLEAPIGAFAVSAADTEPTTPALPPRVYYNNDFSANADGITFAGNEYNRSYYDATGKYLYLRSHQYNGAVAYWNKGEGNNGVLDLPDQFVVSFDFAAIEAYPTWELHLVDESGRYIRVLWGNVHSGTKVLRFLYSDGSGEKKDQEYPAVSTNDAMRHYSVTLLFDMDAGTYSYSYNGRTLKSDLRLLGSGEDGKGAFGKVQYIAIEARGDNKTDGSTPANLILDNLKVYEGLEVLENVPAQNQPENPECSLYDNDFSENANGITFAENEYNRSEYDEDGKYLYLRASEYNGAVAYWNKGEGNNGVLDLPDQFVVSFDFAAIKAYPTWELHLVDESGRYIRVLWGNVHSSDNVLRFLYSDGSTEKKDQEYPAVSTNDAMRHYSVTLLFDMDAGTYSYSYNGKALKSDLLLLGSGENGKGAFGKVQYIALEVRGDDTTATTPANLIVDNLKVISGVHTYTGDCDYVCNNCGAYHWHADTDNDHNCDGCGGVMSECVDEGKDHICDICGVYSGADAKYDPMTMVVPFAFDADPEDAGYVAKFTNLTTDATTEVKTWEQVDEKWCVSLTGITAKQLADEYDVVVTDSAGTPVATFENVSMREYSINKIFYPIGYNSSDGLYEKTNVGITSMFMPFKGTYDGNGNTIANIYQNTWEMKGDHNWYTLLQILPVLRQQTVLTLMVHGTSTGTANW